MTDELPPIDDDPEYADDRAIDEETSAHDRHLPPVHTGPVPDDEGDAGPGSVAHLFDLAAPTAEARRRYNSVSGLSPHQRAVARHIVYNAAVLLLHHQAAVHYTQGSERWQGIDHHLIAAKGQYPHEGDCSSTDTWLLAQALHFHFHLPDLVNGLGWRAGFTGTMASHGRRVEHLGNVLRGDQVLYGRGPNYDHVTTIMHHRGLATPLVFSNGSEEGPFLIPIDYRPDRAMIRRYI